MQVWLFIPNFYDGFLFLSQSILVNAWPHRLNWTREFIHVFWLPIKFVKFSTWTYIVATAVHILKYLLLVVHHLGVKLDGMISVKVSTSSKLLLKLLRLDSLLVIVHCLFNSIIQLSVESLCVSFDRVSLVNMLVIHLV